MTDFLTPKQRSQRMSLIRGLNTKPEIVFRRELHRLGFRYRTHEESLPGRPDLVLRRYGTAIFVHGCFWHQHHGCSIATKPKSNTSFWNLKFYKNKKRDRKNIRQLREKGWHVFVVWECQLSSSRKKDKTVGKIAAKLWRLKTT